MVHERTRRRTESVRRLAQAGLRPTAARQRVLASLLSAGRSLSHRELTDLLHGLDRVTIFRSLKHLKKFRLVHTVQGIDGTLHYVANAAHARGCPGGHAHFLCLGCRTLSCLTDQVMPVVAVAAGTEVHGKQFLVYGLCASCALAKGMRTPLRSNRRRST